MVFSPCQRRRSEGAGPLQDTEALCGYCDSIRLLAGYMCFAICFPYPEKRTGHNAYTLKSSGAGLKELMKNITMRPVERSKIFASGLLNIDDQ